MLVRLTVFILSFFTALTIFAQDPVMLWVEFRDKEHSQYSLSRPHEFLSLRAIQRREQQNIPIDITDKPVTPQYLATLSALEGVEIFYSSRWLNGALLRLRDMNIVQNIAEFDFVVYTEDVKPNNEIKKNASSRNLGGFQSVFVENPEAHTAIFPFSAQTFDTEYPLYGAAENQINLVSGYELHKRGFSGAGKTIALLDAGYRYVDSLEAFQYLWQHNQILGFRDFVNPGGNVFNEHPHGTYVLSVMGAYLANDFSGAAMGAKYWLLRTEDAATEYRIEEYNWLAGAEFADSVGVDIINSSLGYTTFDHPIQNYTYNQLNGVTTIVAKAANMAFNKGILIVNSAGNYGAQSWQYIGSPADSHGALAVGGTNNQGIRANFSSVGPTADGRLKPDIMAQGQGVAVINLMGSVGLANGTSFSSPLIAAMAACLWQSFPLASASELKEAIIKSADRFFNPDSLYGYGIPHFGRAAEILTQQQIVSEVVKLIINPVSSQSTLRIFSNDLEFISIDLFNSNGQKISGKEKIAIYQGYNDIKVFEEIEMLASGIYFLRVNFKSRTELIKAIKL